MAPPEAPPGGRWGREIPGRRPAPNSAEALSHSATAWHWDDRGQRHHPQANSGDRHFASLFPLPFPSAEPEHRGASRVARRRRNLRHYAQQDTVQAVRALNALYGSEAPAPPTCTPAQTSVQHRLLSAARHLRQYFDFIDGKEAFHELLASRGGAAPRERGSMDYSGDGTSVVPYDPELVSLPKVSGHPVDLCSVLNQDAREVLTGFQDQMLINDDDVSHRLRTQHVGSYMDVVLRADRSRYLQFLSSLLSRSLIRACWQRKSRVTPFFCIQEGRQTTPRAGLQT